jgi:uncharacterized protein
MASRTTPTDASLYDVEFVRDVRIPTADPAVSLAADLHLPVGAGPVPLIVLALPYRKDFGASDLLHRYFARRGYGCMTLDLLGTGNSDGDPREPFSADDAQDCVDAILWGAAQSWCDGSVGMWGHSYGGMTTMRAAAMRPAPLKAIMPVQGLIDPEVDFAHPDHARGGFGPSNWMSGMLGNLLVPPVHAPDDEEALARWRKRLDRADTHVLDLFRHPPGASAWRERAVDASLIEVPALCFLGWRDLFADAMARAFEAMVGPKRLIAGPWMHVLPVVTDEGPLDFLGIGLSWWDRWLKDVDNGADGEPSAYYVQGPSPYWTALDAWPARSRTTARVDPGAGTRDIPLTLTSAAETSDPTVGLLSGFTRLATAGVGLPGDQHHDDLKSTCWTSEPLEAALAVVGRPEVMFDRPTPGRVVAKLTHVDPAGRSVLITSGAIGEGLPARHDAVVLDATAYEIPAGHRLRVVLSEADFPRLWPLPPGEAPSVRIRSVSLPTLLPSQVRQVALPEQPAYLLALAATLKAAGGGTTWRLERELVTGRLTLATATTPGAGQRDSGPTITNSSSTAATASPTGPPEVTTSSDWEIRWPNHPVVTVHIETNATDAGFLARGCVTTGDEVTFAKTWTTTPTQGGPR